MLHINYIFFYGILFFLLSFINHVSAVNLLSYFYSATFQKDYNYWNDFFWTDFQSTLGADVCLIGGNKVFYFGPVISESRRFQLPLFLAQESSKISISFNLCIINSASLVDVDIFKISFKGTDSASEVLSSNNYNYNTFSSSDSISCSSGSYKCKKIENAFTITHIQNISLEFDLLDITKNERYLLKEIDISADILTDHLIIDQAKSLCQAHSSFQNQKCQCNDGFYEKKLDATETCNFFPCSYCAPCHGICKTCSGKDIKNCLSCWSNYVYDDNLKTCSLAEKNSAIIQIYTPNINMPIETAICTSNTAFKFFTLDFFSCNGDADKFLRGIFQTSNPQICKSFDFKTSYSPRSIPNTKDVRSSYGYNFTLTFLDIDRPESEGKTEYSISILINDTLQYTYSFYRGFKNQKLCTLSSDNLPELQETISFFKFLPMGEFALITLTIRVERGPSASGNWAFKNVFMNKFLCHSTCLTCHDAFYDSCDSCKNDVEPSNGVCQCPTMSYREDKTFVCGNGCFSNCKTCSNDNVKICEECYEGFTLSEGKCNAKKAESYIQIHSSLFEASQSSEFILWNSPPTINCVESLYVVTQRNFKIQPHAFIFVTFKIYKIDYWIFGSTVKISFNEINRIYAFGDGEKDLCSKSTETDNMQYVQFAGFINSFTLKIVLTPAKLDTEVFGIRDFEINIMKCTDVMCSNCYLNVDVCIKCFEPYLLENNACILKNGFFEDKTQTKFVKVGKCNSGCKKCKSIDVCDECESGYKIANGKCTAIERSTIFVEQLNNTNFDSSKNQWANAIFDSSCGGKGIVKHSTGILSQEFDLSNAVPFIYFTVSFYLERLNDWNHDEFQIKDGEILLLSQNLGLYNEEPDSATCNSGVKFQTYFFSFTLPAQPKLQLSLSSPIIPQWGIRDLKIELSACEINCKSCSLSMDGSSVVCNECYPNMIMKESKCNCLDGYYIQKQEKYPAVICRLCQSRCKKCKEEDGGKCLECYDGFKLEGDSCESENNFLLAVKDFFSSTPSNDETSSWSLIPTSLSVCDAKTYIRFNSKTFDLTAYQPFYGVSFNFTLLQIGNWGATPIKLSINSQEVVSFTLDRGTSPICTTSTPFDELFTISKTFFIPSSPSSSLTFSIPEVVDKAWAVKDFLIEVIGCHISCKTCDFTSRFNQNINICATCYTNADIVDGRCVCKEGWWGEGGEGPGEPRSVCRKCPVLCKTCEGYGKCKECQGGSELIGEKCILNELQIIYNDELNSKDPTLFTDSASKWVGSSNKMIKKCGEDTLLSDTASLKRRIAAAKYLPFFRIYLDFYIFMFDNWNQQKPTLKINDALVDIVSYPQGKKKICPSDIGLADGDDSYLISIQKDILVNEFDIEIISSNGYLMAISDFTFSVHKCHSSCSQCDGSLSSNCLACYENAILNSKQCTCKDGFFLEEIQNNIYRPGGICRMCHSNCKTCTGSSENNCLSCFDYYSLTNGACINDAIATYEINDLDNDDTLQNWNNLKLKQCENNVAFYTFSEASSIEKTFDLKKFSPHFEIDLTLDFYKLNEWNKETVTISIDNTELIIQSYDLNNKQLCGTTNQDEIFKLAKKFSHTKNSLLFKLAVGNNLLQWGIKDLKIKLKHCHSTCAGCDGPLDSQCTKCYNNADLSNHACLCKEGFWLDVSSTINLYPASICRYCHSNCKTCNGGGIDQCLTCFENYELKGSTCETQIREHNIIELSSNQFTSAVLTEWGGQNQKACPQKNIILQNNGLLLKKYDLRKFPFHYSMAFSLSLFKIGAWTGEEIVFSINNVEIAKQSYDINSNNYCGNGESDEIFQIAGRTTNENTQPELKISSSSSPQWGIRDISISLFLCHANCLTCTGPLISQCSTCQLNADLQNDKTCLCKDGFFLEVTYDPSQHPSSICRMCDPTCKKCSSFDNCLECWDNFELKKGKCENKGIFYTINELQNTNSFSNEEITNWNADGQQTCSNYIMLKPKSNSLERTFDLSRFNFKYEVFYIFTLFKIGDWNNNQINIFIDNNLANSQNYERNSKKICSEQELDEIFYISGKIAHISTSINFKITSTFSFALRDFILNLSGCHYSCKKCNGPFKNQCTSCYYNSELNGNNECTCKVGFYMEKIEGMLYPSSICRNCPFSCKSCSENIKCDECYEFYDKIDDKCVEKGKILIVNELNKEDNFNENDASLWGSLIDKIKKCENKPILENNEKKLMRNFDLIKYSGHYRVGYEFVLYKIGDWDDKNLNVIIDDSIVQTQNFGINSKKICSTTFEDEIFTITGQVSHVKSSLKFELTADSLKWAIRSFSLTLFTCHATCKTCSGPSSNMCTSCFLNGKLQEDNTCICESGFYLDLSTNELSYPSAICRLCESSCKKCDKFDECIECWEGMELLEKKCIFKGVKTIINELTSESSFENTDVLNWNGIDVLTCDKIILLAKGKSLSRNFELKTYSNHYQIFYSFNFYKIGDWKENSLEVSFDSKIDKSQVYDRNNKNYCGSDQNDEIFTISGKLDHSSSNLNFLLTSNEATFKYGVRSFSLTLLNCHETCESCSGYLENNCLKCFENSILTAENTCKCIEGFWMDKNTDLKIYPSIICRKCHYTCKTCDKGEATACITCNEYFELKEGKCVYVGTGTIVIELEEIDTFSQNDVQNWGATSTKLCDNTPVLYSADNKLERIIDLSELPRHMNFLYSLQIYKIGEWNKESINIYFDDNLIETQIFSRNSKKICSDKFADEIFFFTGKVIHNALSIKIKITASSNTVQWGIRSLMLMLLSACHPTCRTCKGLLETDCESCYENANLISNNGKKCECKEGFWMDFPIDSKAITSSLCRMCHQNCESCSGGEENQCKTCKSRLTLKDALCQNEIPFFIITDLIETTQFSDSSLKEWSSDRQQICDNLPILKPKADLKEITKIFNFNQYSPHFEVLYNFSVYKIDEWNGGKLQLYMDGNLEIEQEYSTNSKKICSTSKSDEIFHLTGKLIHNTNTLAVKLSSSLSSLFYGIRSFFFALSKCHVSCSSCSGPLETDCSTCYPNFELKLGKCTILNKFYVEISKNDLNPSVVGRMCHATCLTCQAGGESDCLSCFGYGVLKEGACVTSIPFFIITDLIETTQFSDSSLKEWDSDRQQICDNLPILRPKADLKEITKTFNLNKYIPHFEILYDFSVYKIDEWNGGKLQLYMDGNLEIEQEYSTNSKNICSTSKTDEIFHFTGKLIHNTITLTAKLSSSSSSLFYGIRSLFFTLSKCHFSCSSCTGPLETDCSTCYPNFELKEGKCTIFNKFYVEVSKNDLNPSVVARMCHATCLTCQAGGESDCLSCFEYGVLKEGACLTSIKDSLSYSLSLTDSTDLIKYPQNAILKCGDVHLLSFTDKTIIRTFDLKYLKPHWKLSLITELYKIGTWNGEKFEIYIDNSLLASQNFGINSKKICSDGENDDIFTLSGQLEHTAETATLKIISPQSLSWALSKLSISLSSCHSSCSKCVGPLKNSCSACYQNSDLNNGNCECKIGFYFDDLNKEDVNYQNELGLSPSSICRSCHAFCKSCTSGGPTGCLDCNDNFEKKDNECIPKFNYFGVSDLTELTSFSEQQLINWNGNKYQICDNNAIMKPKETYLERKLNLEAYAPYFLLGYSLSFYKIGEWKGEILTVYLNDAALYSMSFFENSKKICSASYVDEIYPISGLTETSQKSISFKIKSSTSLIDWGIRNFNLNLFFCPPTCLTCAGSKCTSCYLNANLKNDACSCSDGFWLDLMKESYLTPSSICRKCHLNCKTCDGKGYENCLSCYEHYELKGNICFFAYENVTFSELSSTTIDQNEILSWNAEKIIDCSAKQILYAKINENLIKKYDFKRIRPFYQVAIDFSLYKIGKWNEENLDVFIDEIKVYSQSFNINSKAICGSDKTDEIYQINFRQAVSSKSFIISLHSPLTAGIRDLNIALLFCHSTCLSCIGPLNNQCTACDENFNLNNNECLCKDGFYLYNSLNVNDRKDNYPMSQCRICHENCKTCNGPTEKECLECREGFETKESACAFKGTSFIFEELTEKNGIQSQALVNWSGEIIKCTDNIEYVKPTKDKLTRIFDFSRFINKNSVQFSFELYKFGDWNNDAIDIYADDSKIITQKYGLTSFLKVCSADYLDDKFYIATAFTHTKTSLNIKISSTSQSWGIKNMKLSLLFNCDPTCLECSGFKINECTKCYENAILTKENKCICLDGFYMDVQKDRFYYFPSSICRFCHMSCKTCFGGQENECLSCQDEATIKEGKCEFLSPNIPIAFNELTSKTSFSQSEIDFWKESTQLICSSSAIIMATKFNLIRVYDFKTLIPHYKILFSFLFYKIGDWENSSLEIFADQKSIMSQKYSKNSKSICSENNIYDEVFYLASSFSHTYQNLSLEIKGKQGLSWGIRDFHISLIKCHFSCESCFGSENNNCNSCFFNADLVKNVCQCKNGFYLRIPSNGEQYSTSVCSCCHSSCKTCKGGNSWECLSCYENYTLTSNKCIYSGSTVNFYELNSNTTFSSDELTEWNNAKEKLCDEKPLIFSDNGKIDRTLTIVNISERTGFEYSFILYKFGDWNNEDFIFSVNNKEVIKQKFNLSSASLCNNEMTGEKNLITGKIDDPSNAYHMVLSSSNKNWAIRDFRTTLLLALCHYSCLTCSGSEENQCLTCFQNLILINSQCLCEDGMKPNIKFVSDFAPVVTCDPCDEKCKNAGQKKFSPIQEEVTSPSDFAKWNLSPNIIKSCSSYSVFTEKELLDSKIYQVFQLNELPPHFAITVNFTFIKFGGVQKMEKLSVDGFIYDINADGTKLDDTCFDKMGYSFFISQKVPHLGSNLSISLISSDIDSTFFWSINSFSLDLFKCDKNCLTCSSSSSSSCLSCYPFSEIKEGECQCLEGFYSFFYENCIQFPCSKCLSCHSSCKSCWGEGKEKCNGCRDDMVLIGGKCLPIESKSNFTFEELGTTFFMSKEIKNWDIDIKIKTSRLLAVTDLNNYLTFCDNYFFIFGGEDVFKGDVKIVRNITDLKNHYGGSLKLKIYKFTKGTLLENILLSIAGSKDYVVRIEQFTLIERFCTKYDDTLTHYQQIEWFFPHTDPLFSLSISSIHDEDSSSESWAIKDLLIEFYFCDSSCLKCSGPSSSECLECDVTKGLYYEKQACVTECSFSNFKNDFTGICEACPSTCLSCNADGCLSCSSSSDFLLDSRCVAECPTGYYDEYNSDQRIQICQKCHSSCQECYGEGSDQCLSCKSSKDILIENKCITCDSSCLTCTGSSVYDCVTCQKNYFRYKNTCVARCPNGLYPQTLDFTQISDTTEATELNCLDCDSSCLTCSGPSKLQCLSCSFSKLKGLLGDCVSDCVNGTFSNGTNCVVCDQSCLECKGPGSYNCTKCGLSFVLDEKGGCGESKINKFELIEVNNPYTFALYIDPNPNLELDQYYSILNVNVSGFDNLEYDYEIKLSVENASLIYFYFTFEKLVDINSFLTINMRKSLTNNDLSNTISTIVQLKKTLICVDGAFLFNGSCVISNDEYRPIINIYILETSDAQTFKIRISNGDANSNKIIIEFLKLTIQPTSAFSYKIERTSDNYDKFDMTLNFTNALVGKYVMTISVEIPEDLKKTIDRNIILSRTTFELPDIYQLSESDIQTVQNTNNFRNGVENAAVIITAVSLVSFPTFGSIKLLVLSITLCRLKYLTINYPPNMQEFFKMNNKQFPLFLINYNDPDKLFLKFSDDIESDSSRSRFENKDLFTKYGMRLNLIQNFGDNVLQILLIFLIAKIIIFLEKKIQNNNIVKKLLIIIQGVLVWGYILSYFIVRFCDITLYIFRSWYFCKFDELYSYLDLLISISLTLVCLFILIYIVMINQEIYRFNRNIEIKEINSDPKKRITKPLEKAKSIENSERKPIVDNEAQIKLTYRERRNSQIALKSNLQVMEKKYNVLIKEFERGDIMKINYIEIELCKFTLISAILVFLYGIPFLQSILLIFINVYFIVYLAIYRPHLDKFKILTMIIQEIIVLIAFVFVSILAYSDLTADNDPTYRLLLGNIFLYCNFCLALVFVVSQVQGILHNIKEKFAERKLKSLEKELKLRLDRSKSNDTKTKDQKNKKEGTEEEGGVSEEENGEKKNKKKLKEEEEKPREEEGWEMSEISGDGIDGDRLDMESPGRDRGIPKFVRIELVESGRNKLNKLTEDDNMG